MRAAIRREYGGPEVARVEDVTEPEIGPRGILVRVAGTSVNALDYHSMRGTPYLIRSGTGIRRPRRPFLGADVAGTVEAIGSEILQVRVGDRIFGQSIATFAELVGVSDAAVVAAPTTIPLEMAAAVPLAGLTALQAVRDSAGVRQGHRVLINGAAGGVGTFAVQVAVWLGAEVTAVTSGRNADLVRELGAHATIDYARDDFAAGSTRYDAIIDVGGNRDIGTLQSALTATGVAVLCAPRPGNWVGPVLPLLAAPVLSRKAGRRILSFATKRTLADLTTLQQLVDAGTIAPVIDSTFSLDETADAIARVESGHARGKVAITVP